MEDVMEFGFDEAKVIQTSSIEKFKQDRTGKVDKVSIIAFRKFSDQVLRKKTIEKNSPLTDEEKADVLRKVDAKLSERLKKDVSELTEIDRLDLSLPRFAMARTHYGDDVGTIRCLSTWDGNTITRRALCCDRLDEADQTVGTIVVRYPIDKEGTVDIDLLKQRKYTAIEIWKMGAKKFKRVESVYNEARANQMNIIDLRVELDGEQKYQKQIISTSMHATWARQDIPEEIRQWLLNEGLKAFKHIEKELGFQMKPETLSQKLLGSSSSSGSSAANAPAPALQASYNSFLED
jgi:hypothetical protein